jgi:hypothetical protein
MLIYGAALEAAPGKGGELVAQVPALRDACAEATGTPWWAWMVLSGRPFGSFVLSTRHEGYEQMLEAGMLVGASPEFQSLSTGFGGLLAHPAETTLNEVIGVQGEAGDPKPIVVLTRATMMGGHFADALAWSAKALEHVDTVTGSGGVVALSSTGALFQVTWMTGADDAAQLDANNAKLNADPDYIALLDEAGDYFVPGSSERMVIVRMD